MLAETFQEGLEKRLEEGSVWYTAYEDDRLITAGQEKGCQAALLEFNRVQITDAGVQVSRQVLLKAGLVNREIVVSEKGISTTDTPVARRTQT